MMDLKNKILYLMAMFELEIFLKSFYRLHYFVFIPVFATHCKPVMVSYEQETAVGIETF